MVPSKLKTTCHPMQSPRQKNYYYQCSQRINLVSTVGPRDSELAVTPNWQPQFCIYKMLGLSS